VAALALVVPLGLAPLREAAAQRTSTAQWSFGVGSAKPLTVSAVIRRLPGFSELEYDDTSHVRGLTADLNGDGRADYIIQSAESLCGNGGCDYLIVDGATRREIGTVFGGTVYVDPTVRGTFPVLRALSHASAESASWTEYRVIRGRYVNVRSRIVRGAALDSLMRTLPRAGAGAHESSRGGTGS
jgi:hypothetical protein